MDDEILLAQLRALLERTPDFDAYDPASREHLTWLGQAHALVGRWDSVEAVTFPMKTDMLFSPARRPMYLGQILATLHRAIADLEFRVPAGAQVAFGPGDVYDFFRAFNFVVESAEKTLLIVDPYMDQKIFDLYLSSRPPAVSARLLTSRYADDVKIGAELYIQQHGLVLQLRRSKKIHDRVMFIDGSECYVTGQSLKDAAKAKPTYLSPLAPDVVPDKLRHYEEIWGEAEVL